MQRRNVDFPEPDGPRMHITSPGSTSSEMPFSTSRRPKRLWTSSAFTIGALIVSSIHGRNVSRVLRHRCKRVGGSSRAVPRPKWRSR